MRQVTPFMFGDKKAELIVTESGFFVVAAEVVILDASTSFREPNAWIEITNAQENEIYIDIDANKNETNMGVRAK